MARSSALRALTIVSSFLVAALLLVSCASSAPRSASAEPKPKARPPAVSSQQPKQALGTQPSSAARRPHEPSHALRSASTPAAQRTIARLMEPDLMPTDPADLAEARRKGWGFMVEKLADDGVSRGRAAATFADPRMPAFDGLLFGINPREPHSMYRGFLKPSSMAQAARCATTHAHDLRDAERLHGVDASVIAAIMHVETHCGRNTGRDMVLHRLARLAMANEPRNVAKNLNRYKNPDAELAERVRSRARYLEGIFYPQVVATFEIARQEGISPLALRGSGAGAFGYVQFLPMNYVAFGTDADGDGKVSLYEPADAAASAARFLASHGWKPGIKPSKKREVIWHYNRSEAYIDTVLALARHIRASGVVDPRTPGTAEARVRAEDLEAAPAGRR
jgi:membrane-bound lytic murein transglycosylase B